MEGSKKQNAKLFEALVGGWLEEKPKQSEGQIDVKQRRNFFWCRKGLTVEKKRKEGRRIKSFIFCKYEDQNFEASRYVEKTLIKLRSFGGDREENKKKCTLLIGSKNKLQKKLLITRKKSSQELTFCRRNFTAS